MKLFNIDKTRSEINQGSEQKCFRYLKYEGGKREYLNFLYVVNKNTFCF